MAITARVEANASTLRIANEEKEGDKDRREQALLSEQLVPVMPKGFVALSSTIQRLVEPV
jgi:hypothetical protein